MTSSKIYGHHYLVELLGCDPSRIQQVSTVEHVFLEAARISGATIVEHFFKQYEPEGVTGIILISESHFAIHTWPEDGFVALDIFTCGTMDSQAAIDFLKQEFGAQDVRQRLVERHG